MNRAQSCAQCKEPVDVKVPEGVQVKALCEKHSRSHELVVKPRRTRGQTPRHVAECTWHGPSGDRPCHRVVLRTKRAIENYSRISSVTFTDNTTMTVSVRQLNSHERVEEIHGYDHLFSDIFRAGVTGNVRVSEVQK